MKLRDKALSVFLGGITALSAQAQEPQLDIVEYTYTMSDQAFDFVNHVCNQPYEDRDFAVADNASGHIIVIQDCQTEFMANALFGRQIFDSDPGKANYATLSGRYDNAHLIYHPSYDYLEGNVILAIYSNPEHTAYVGIHATTSTKRQANMADGNPNNNNVTGGCIDTTPRAMKALIRVFNDGQDFTPSEPTAHNTKMTVFVLPSEDTSLENTLRVTGFLEAPEL